MKMIDCHMHYVKDASAVKKIVCSSQWKDIYLGYREIKFEKLDIMDHIYKCDGGFIMPYCFKETDVNEANRELAELKLKFTRNNFYFLPFITDSVSETLEDKNVIGMKEHFYIHDSFKYFERKKSYTYLSDHKKMLILHCDNSIRIDYVRYLLEHYPNMIVQVAHMGVFRNSLDASKLVIDKLSGYDNVYFDISTVFDTNIIKYAYQKMPDRILFGTDVPYLQEDAYFEKYNKLILECQLDSESIEKIYYKNAECLLERILL